MINLQKIARKISDVQEKTKCLVDGRIEKQKKSFQRKYKREMDEEELASYKFRLFITYSFVGVVPLIFLFSIM